MSTQPGTEFVEQGPPPEAVGFRNQFRARWRSLPALQRAAISIFIALVIALLFYFALDHALGFALLTITAIYWLLKLPFYPRVACEVILVGTFLVFGPRSFAAILAVVFSVSFAPERTRRWLVPTVALVAAVLYPFYQPKLFTIPVFGVWPDVATGVYMLVFIMMAVGLNIVVGYAGLLDLGYVAFYAMGAYTAAWFASLQFPHQTIHFGAVGIDPHLPGIHVTLWLLLPLAGILTAATGIIIGLPTLRLRGDYLAIVTLGFGEILPQIARNSDNFLGTGFNLTNGPNGITPLDPLGFGNHLSRHPRLPACQLPDVLQGVVLRAPDPVDGRVLLDRDRPAPDHGVLLVPVAVLAARPRVDRHPRGRDRRRGHVGVPLMRTKTWAYATGAFFGGIAGAYYASFKSATFPGDFYFNISVFILCMVILGGMGNVTGVLVGAAFLAYLNQEGLANTGAWLNTHISVIGNLPPRSRRYGQWPRRSSVRLGHLRLDHPARHALPGRRADPVETSRRRIARGRPRPAALRRDPRGRMTTEQRVETGGDNILVADGLRKEFGGLVAVNDVSFNVPRGKVISLIGPNGAGKTTFFNMLTGVYKPTGGTITLLGEDVTGKPPHAITQRGIGRTFQNIRLFQNMSALENVLVGMHSGCTRICSTRSCARRP